MRAEELETVMARIRKCMALSESPHPGEAAAALRMAQAIMEKHGIKSEDVEASEVDSGRVCLGGRRSAKFYSWAKILVSTINMAFGSRAIIGTPSNVITFYGLNGSGEISAYAFQILLRKVKAERKALIKKMAWSRMTKDQKTTRADAYATGWVYGAGENIIPRAVKEDEERKIKSKIDAENNDVRDDKHKISKEILAQREFVGFGFKEGKKYQLRRGVETGEEALCLTEGKDRMQE
jgi:hypothetical protein